MKNKKEIKILDGNHSAAYISYACNEMAAIYPITPSSPMAELSDKWSSEGKKNIFGTKMNIFQMQSEAGAAGSIHGSLSAGVTSTTFTSSQGLLLMLPTMYKIAGELKPTVFNVSARTVSTHALSIFGDHSDVMACRQTGFAMISSSNPQEVMDLSLLSNLSTIESRIPFLNFFDGFDTSHQLKNVETIDYNTIKKNYPFNKYNDFKNSGLNPETPHQQGVAQGPDTFFQNKEASNTNYISLKGILKSNLRKLNNITGRNYNFFDYYGSETAKYIIVSMGSSCDNIELTIDELRKQNITDIGLIKVRVYRPFFEDEFLKALPNSIKSIAVLDRTKEQGASNQPLALDIISSLYNYDKKINVYSGVYGIGGKELIPGMIKSIYDKMRSEKLNTKFTVGINDDVTNLSIDYDETFLNKEESFNVKVYGLGGEGMISASKNILEATGKTTDLNTQAIFEHDSKKSGSLTISNLRFSKKKIKSNYNIKKADIIVVATLKLINKYNLLEQLNDDSILIINGSKKEFEKQLDKIKIEQIKNKNLTILNINIRDLIIKNHLFSRTNIMIQATILKYLKIIDFDSISNKVKELNEIAYNKKGVENVENNNKAFDIAVKNIEKIDISKLQLSSNKSEHKADIKSNYYESFIKPSLNLNGNKLPVSSFNKYGNVPTNTSKFEKREISDSIPFWIPEKCIQCNKCSFVCPHSAIKPVLISEEEAEKSPGTFYTVKAKGEDKNLRYRIQINPYDCTGCSNCIDACPTMALNISDEKNKIKSEKENYNYSLNLKNEKSKFNKDSVKGLQYKKSYFEFSGACAGCGETAYIKTLTQLFGDNLIISNATGCSSIYGGSAPTCPYSTNDEGAGPAWASSLFENNAEFGFGIKKAYQFKEENMKKYIEFLINEYTGLSELNNIISFLKMWKKNQTDIEKLTKIKSLILNEVAQLRSNSKLDLEIIENLHYIEKNQNYLIPKTIWLIGGDGWAYDIGYGGLDHILNTEENINILVLDNQNYSNTGGQVSKSTPKGSIAKFASSGKTTAQKDLSKILTINNNAYVASISMGANNSQTIKALKEAQEYDGPSVVVAYSPCITHGFNMTKTQTHMKEAVKSGYWPIFRYNPKNKKFILDGKNVDFDKYESFLKSEKRFNSLDSVQIFEDSKTQSKQRHETYVKKSYNEE